jgi:hypothetical protein
MPRAIALNEALTIRPEETIPNLTITCCCNPP